MNVPIYTEPLLSVLVLGYQKPEEARQCLESIRAHVHVPYKLVYLDNGGAPDYAWDLHKSGLCDVLISKQQGRGGGFGQTDLFRYCDTEYALFVQCDQTMRHDLPPSAFAHLTKLLDIHQCVDLNGDQSNKGIWTDRAHLIKTALFNSLAPFPNGGPGNDAAPWNEAYLQRVFAERGYTIAHIRPAIFRDDGVWSVREAGDGLYRHRCDTKAMYVLKVPTYRTEVYPPFNDAEWATALAGGWVDGTIPEAWKEHSFQCWPLEYPVGTGRLAAQMELPFT